MGVQKLIEEAKLFKSEANQLLRESNLLKTLNSYGSIHFTGSYELNLMLNPDIDIYVINPKITKEVVVSALNDLIRASFFNGYLFFDWVKFSKEVFPEGYYIGLKTKYKGKKWKIDIWLITKKHKKGKQLMEKVAKLSEEDRNLILELKKYRNENDLKVDSADIYRAVIDGKISSIKGFEEKLCNPRG